MAENKRLDPVSSPDFKGDLPDEIDLWFGDEIEYEDLSPEGKKVIDSMMEKDED